MSKLSMFFPITKIDAAQRLVYGIATAEKVDRSGEICDYATTKPYYEKWSADIAKASGGKSLGNVRAMHGKVAAGKLTALTCNDDEKQFEICTKVVDEAEWEKVKEGVYTGFSQGGAYVKRWKDSEGLQRYTADPIEVSLVDVPCLPEATFEFIKSDGSTEMRKFSTVVTTPSFTDIGNRADVLAKKANDGRDWKAFADAAHQELLDEAIAAAEAAIVAEQIAAEPVAKAADGTDTAEIEASVPVAKEPEGKKVKKWVEPKQLWVCGHAEHEHLNKADAVRCMKDDDASDEAKKLAAPAEDALSKIESALGIVAPAIPPVVATPAATEIADKFALDVAIKAYEAGDQKGATVAKRTILKAVRALDAMDMLPPTWAFAEKAVSLYGVANLVQLLAAIDDAEECFEMDSYWGGSVNATDDLKTRFGAVLVEFGDIVAEALDAVLSDMSDEEKSEAMTRYSPLVDLMKAGARHSKTDQANVQKLHDLAVNLGAGCDAGKDTAGKSVAGDDLTKLQTENEALKSQISTMGTRLDAVMAKVEQMAKQPAPAKAALLAVGKGEDGGQVKSQTNDAEDFAKTLEGMSEQERSRELMKLALKFPQAGHPAHRTTDAA